MPMDKRIVSLELEYKNDNNNLYPRPYINIPIFLVSLGKRNVNDTNDIYKRVTVF